MTQQNNIREADQVEQDRVLKSFFEDGRLKALPIKRKKRFYVLSFLAQRFETGRNYMENEVNAIILPVFEDYCTIRRELVDYGFMERDSIGYRRLKEDGWLPEL